jgi:hypothetical protein
MGILSAGTAQALLSVAQIGRGSRRVSGPGKGGFPMHGHPADNYLAVQQKMH